MRGNQIESIHFDDEGTTNVESTKADGTLAGVGGAEAGKSSCRPDSSDAAFCADVAVSTLVDSRGAPNSLFDVAISASDGMLVYLASKVMQNECVHVNDYRTPLRNIIFGHLALVLIQSKKLQISRK